MMEIAGKTVELFPPRTPGAPLVVLNTVMGEGAATHAAIAAATDADFALAAIGGLDWNDDLSPWPCGPVFKGDGGFGGGADRYLSLLTGEILPNIIDALPAPPKYVALAGYSLAGLFALYAPHHTDVFDRVASASGSTWFPGFVEYVQTHPMARVPGRVYLSVGDREARTKNAVMRPVEDNARALAAWYRERGIASTFVLDPGGHFKDAEARVARAVAWIISEGDDV